MLGDGPEYHPSNATETVDAYFDSHGATPWGKDVPVIEVHISLDGGEWILSRQAISLRLGRPHFKRDVAHDSGVGHIF
jgi:hypothetical protein